MPLGPAVGTVSYNGFTFPPALHSKAVMTPVYDSSGRTVKYTKLMLEIECIITGDMAPVSTPSAAIDQNLLSIRFLLQQSRKQLIFINQGLGVNLRINMADGSDPQYIDVDYGPKPEELIWETVGSNRAARVIWRCTSMFPECGTSLNIMYTVPKVSEFNYTVDWGLSAAGMTRRTISGHLEIALNANYLATTNTNLIPATADQYRNWFTIPQVPQFRREQEYSLSEDRRQLKFRIVDEQINSPNPYLPGVVECDASHEVGSDLLASKGPLSGRGFVSWDSTISMTVKLSAEMPQHYAWFIFLLIVQDRLSRISTGAVTKSSQCGGNTAETPRYFVKTIKIREEIYKREIKASISYLIICNPLELFAASGMFQLTPGDWDVWRVSMANTHSRRGYANMSYNAADDIIVNMCNTPTVVFGQPMEYPNKSGQTGIFTNQCPLPQHSWLDFKNFRKYQEQANTVSHTKLSENPISGFQSTATPNPVTARSVTDKSLVNQSGQQGGSNTQVFVESRGSSLHTVRQWGWAVRIGYPINPPILVKYAGQKTTRISKNDTGETTISAGGCLIYVRWWDQLYSLENIPQGNAVDCANTITDGIPEYYQQ